MLLCPSRARKHKYPVPHGLCFESSDSAAHVRARWQAGVLQSCPLRPHQRAWHGAWFDAGAAFVRMRGVHVQFGGKQTEKSEKAKGLNPHGKERRKILHWCSEHVTNERYMVLLQAVEGRTHNTSTPCRYQTPCLPASERGELPCLPCYYPHPRSCRSLLQSKLRTTTHPPGPSPLRTANRLPTLLLSCSLRRPLVGRILTLNTVLDSCTLSACSSSALYYIVHMCICRKGLCSYIHTVLLYSYSPPCLAHCHTTSAGVGRVRRPGLLRAACCVWW